MSLSSLLRSPVIRWDRAFMRKLILIALPIVIQNLVSASLHIIDGLMLSQLPGDAPYAGVTQANRFTFVFQLFCFGAASGCSIYMSQYFGNGETKRMRMVLGLALRITLALSLLFAGLALFAPQMVVSLFLEPGESFDYAVRYLRIVAPGYFLTAIDACYAGCLKSSQRTAIPMLAGVAGIGVNTLLNYVLIFGHWGFPALGVEGAALATVIAGGVTLFIDLGFTYGKKLPAAARLSDFRLPDKAYLKAFFRKVLPVVANEGLWSMGMAMYSVFYGRLGDQALSAVGIYNSVDQLVFVIIYGLMNASAIWVGSQLGAGDKEGACLTAKRMLAGAIATGAVMGVLLLALRYPLVSFFAISPQGQEMALKILGFAACFLWMRAINSINVVGILRAGGDTLFSMLLDGGAVWLCGVPLVGIAALVFHWPVEYVYLCSLVEEALKVTIGLPRFKSGKWLQVLSSKG